MVGMGMFVEIVIPCPICKTKKHTDDCPVPLLEGLRKRARHLPCPKCNSLAVGRNAMDYFECRQCHTQFCSSAIADCQDPSEEFILDQRQDRLIKVLVMQTKGDPMDQAADSLQQKISEMLAQADG